MTTLTKADLTVSICEQMGLTRSEVEKIIELFFESIAEKLASGENVKFSKFGNFTLIDKDPRPGRNPKTGEPVQISARRVVTFKAGNKLKSRIKDAMDGTSDEKS